MCSTIYIYIYIYSGSRLPKHHCIIMFKMLSMFLQSKRTFIRKMVQRHAIAIIGIICVRNVMLYSHTNVQHYALHALHIISIYEYKSMIMFCVLVCQRRLNRWAMAVRQVRSASCRRHRFVYSLQFLFLNSFLCLFYIYIFKHWCVILTHDCCCYTVLRRALLFPLLAMILPWNCFVLQKIIIGPCSIDNKINTPKIKWMWTLSCHS